MIGILKQLKLDYRIKAGYGFAFLLLLLSYILTWYANQQVMEQSKWINHTNAVITHLDGLVSYVKDAETGVRGYIITKDKVFLEPYNHSMPNVDSTFDFLKKETADNSTEQIHIYAVKLLIDKKFNLLNHAIRSFEEDNFHVTQRILNASYAGKAVMDSIRTEIRGMETSEQQLLQDRRNELQSRYNAMNIIIVTSLILAFVFAFFGLVTLIRENMARKKADSQVAEYQSQLQKRIEELDIANKELVQMKRTEQFAATGRIARTIAHEVRNPLTNIDLASSQLRSELPETDEGAGILFDMISRNSKRINQLITELLNATRFVDLTYRSVSINTLLDEALELAQDRIELTHIFLQKKYDKEICDISVDPDKIKIAFLNIIVNAVEAMEPGSGILKIITREENNKCVVEITDNGAGMDAESVSKLFEPYYTTKSKGNGLGLTNTQNIILNHQGSINVESTVGKGTTFIIKFNFASSK